MNKTITHWNSLRVRVVEFELLFEIGILSSSLLLHFSISNFQDDLTPSNPSTIPVCNNNIHVNAFTPASHPILVAFYEKAFKEEHFTPRNPIRLHKPVERGVTFPQNQTTHLPLKTPHFSLSRKRPSRPFATTTPLERAILNLPPFRGVYVV